MHFLKRVAVVAALALPSLLITTAPEAAATPPDSVCVTLNLTDTLTASSAFFGNDCVISFTSGSGRWIAPDGLVAANLLIIGGGGGGGAAYDSAGAGGGGAGLVSYQNIYSIKSGAAYFIRVGAAGAGGVGSSSAPRETAGGNGGDSTINLDGDSTVVRAFGGNGGSGSRTLAAGNSGVGKAGGAMAIVTAGGKGGNVGGGGGGAGGGGGNFGDGTNGGTGVNSGGTGGAGAAWSTRTNTSIFYGIGGNGGAPVSGTGTGSAGTAGTTAGSGGNGGSSGGSSQANGGAGASGLVVIRYRLPAEFSAVALSSGLPTAIFRRDSTINVTMNFDSKVTFKIDGVRVPGCISLRTTGSVPTWTSSCTWKPAKRGAVLVSVTATPLSTGVISSTTLRIGVAQRSNTR